MSNAIILFDGVCNLCNASVQFVIKRDKNEVFSFASLQSETGNEMVKKYSLGNELNSFVLIDNDIAHTESTAALRVLKKLGGGWSFFYGFIIVPPFVRDGIYRYISRNRYRFFGKQESCMVPTPELKKKFLD